MDRTRTLGRRIGQLLLCLCLLACLAPAPCGAASLIVTWDANSESDLAGYLVYYGKVPETYSCLIVVPPRATSYRLEGLEPETTYYVALTAYDFTGNESDFSEEASETTGCDAPLILYRDFDGDGWGWEEDRIESCGPISGWVSNCADCDDGDPSIRPGALEVRDGRDNNCNGLIDEGLARPRRR